MLLILSLFSLQLRVALPDSITVESKHRVYRFTAPCDVTREDFRNFTYFSGEWMGYSRPTPPLRVRGGAYHFGGSGDFEDLTIKGVWHPPGDPSSAIVSLLHSYGGGSSNQELVVMVFRCVDGKLTNTQLIHGDGHGGDAGVFLSADGSQMTMRSVSDYSQGHCCPKYQQTANFVWRRGKYALTGTTQSEIPYPR